jgi:hypothetical protein
VRIAGATGRTYTTIVVLLGLVEKVDAGEKIDHNQTSEFQ